jgi:hypothetical protein
METSLADAFALEGLSRGQGETRKLGRGRLECRRTLQTPLRRTSGPWHEQSRRPYEHLVDRRIGDSRQSFGLVTRSHTLNLQRHRLLELPSAFPKGCTANPQTGSLLVPRLGAWLARRARSIDGHDYPMVATSRWSRLQATTHATFASARVSNPLRSRDFRS